MKANRAFELIVSRGGFGPAFLAGDERLDRIELVSIDDGEVVRFWDVAARDGVRLARELRGDLASLDDAAFLAKWSEDA